MLQVVVFSGGRGSKTIVKELLKDESIALSLIVNAYDDGKSTGEIRRFFNMLGPSDIRKNQENLMSNHFESYKIWSEIFAFRFPQDVQHDHCISVFQDFADGKTNMIEEIQIDAPNLVQLLRRIIQQFLTSLKTYEKIVGRSFDFSDCSLSNCLYAGAYELLDKSFNKTIALFNVLLHTRGDVIPTNLENKKLVAIRENGEICYSEDIIVELRSNDRIKDLFLLDKDLDPAIIEDKFTTLEEKSDYLHRIESYVQGTSESIKAIENADIIIYAPGTQHSSLYPSYTTIGIPEAISSNKKALKAFVCNIGEDYETPGYEASEFITSAYKYLTKNCKFKIPITNLIHVALINTSRSEKKEDFRYVENDFQKLEELPIEILCGNFESDSDLGKHDAHKAIKTIEEAYYKKFYKNFFNETYKH